jgi:hypothetical protein
MSDKYVFEGGFPAPEAVTGAENDAAFARAVVAYRFWYPTVSVEGIFNGNRKAGLQDNEAMGIAATGPLQVGFTLNSDTPYGAGTLDLSDGPMVIELPPGAYIGLVDDHHQRWVMDLGISGSRGPTRGRADGISCSRPATTAPSRTASMPGAPTRSRCCSRCARCRSAATSMPRSTRSRPSRSTG